MAVSTPRQNPQFWAVIRLLTGKHARGRRGAESLSRETFGSGSPTMSTEGSSERQDLYAENRVLIEDICSGCRCPGTYCTLREILIRSPRNVRILVQIKCIEKLKYERSAAAKVDIGWWRADEIWVSEGYADVFFELYDARRKVDSIYAAVCRKVAESQSAAAAAGAPASLASAEADKLYAENRALIDDICSGCCPPSNYCTLKEILVRSPRDARTLVQIKCIEKFKYERSAVAMVDIGTARANMAWVDDGCAEAFAENYRKGMSVDTIYGLVMKAVASRAPSGTPPPAAPPRSEGAPSPGST
jgi:hypothetical protein